MKKFKKIAFLNLKIEETGGIEILKCFFCAHTSNTAEEKCEHMAKEHSFYIPSLDHVSDLEGLLKFLGIKLGVYHVCFWCSSKCYRDLLSVQRHMADKGHQKLKFDGDTLIEYADFYSFGDDEDDETIDDEYDIVNRSALNESRLSKISNRSEDDDGTINGDSYDEEMFELCLPSGARIGHRSLFRYYKQSFGHRNLEMKQRSNVSLRDKYKAIALGGAYTRKISFENLIL
jgi:pre-60S factor REI1